jgi:hypothetical protein
MALASADAATSPSSLRAAILKAASAKHSVHYVAKSSGRYKGQPEQMTQVADVGAGRGIQRITIMRAGETGHVTIRVVNSTAYIRGDAFALHTYMAVPTSQAAALAGRWISIPHTSPAYAPVAADVTFSSFVSHLLPQHHLSLVTGTVGGKKVRGVHGTAHEEGVTVTLTAYAPASGTPLPFEVKDIIQGPDGGTGSTSLSRWNESVRVTAPANAIPA